MSIRIEKRNVVFDNDSNKCIEPEYVFFDTKKVEEYLKQNPFPSTEYYTAKDLLLDVLYTHGTWWIPIGITVQQKDYIIKIVRTFYNRR